MWAANCEDHGQVMAGHLRTLLNKRCAKKSRSHQLPSYRGIFLFLSVQVPLRMLQLQGQMAPTDPSAYPEASRGSLSQEAL